MTLGLIDFDGCGDGDRSLTLWSSAAFTNVGTTYGTFGGYGFQVLGLGGNATRYLKPENTAFGTTHIIAGCHRYMESAQDMSWCFKEGTTTHIEVYVQADGTIQVYRGTGKTSSLGATAAGVFPLTQWVFMVVDLTIADGTGGSCYIYLYGTGTPVLSCTSVDTRNGGTAGVIDNLNWGGPGNSHQRVDDLYIIDATVASAVQLGSVVVGLRAPNADSTPLEWDSSGANHWSVVDEQPFSDADYIQTAVNGEKDLMTVSDDGKDYQPYGVRLIGRMLKTDADSCQARLIIKDGANYGSGTTRNLSAAAVYYRDCFEVRPGGAGEWTQAALDALAVGAEKVA